MGEPETRGCHLRLVTFYADCVLPIKSKEKQEGFDWHHAMRMLSASAEKSLGVETLVATDSRTSIPAALRVGDAKRDGLMLWLLDAQAACMEVFAGDLLLVSPDTLINGPVPMFGDWDLCLLTRAKPKPIVNSVIAVRSGPAVSKLWARIAREARGLSEESKAWGADIDAVVNALQIKPLESGIRTVDGVRVRFLPINGVFETVNGRRPSVPIWDFKGKRKKIMHQYFP